MKKRFGYAIYVLFVLFFLSSCATYRIRLGSAREWIEGKPFPVEITFSETEKIAGVVLRYSFNGTSTKTVSMNRSGNYFAYTIPGEEVVPGKLRYDIAYQFSGKAKSTGSVSVKILSLAEAKQKYTRELRSRISFSPPAKVPVNRDTQLTVKVSAPRPSTKVMFFYKIPTQSSFQEVELKSVNGVYSAIITESELRAGYNTYYFVVTEENADVGELKVFVNGRDSVNPFQFTILSLAELKEVIIGELYTSVSHSIPQDVYATRDLKILLSVQYASDTFISEFSRNSVSVEIFYKSPTSGLKRGVMFRTGNQFTYNIPSAELKAGYNTYYFKITDNIEDIGLVTIDYPESGELLSYRILSVEEIRAQKISSLYRRIAHTPVTEADGISDLLINLRVENAKSTTTAVLYFKRPTTRRYKSIEMTRKRNNFTGVISADEQQSGYTQYYFVVKEEDSDVGAISAEFPENGRQNPIQFTVLDKNIVKARLESDLRSRISHTPVASAAEGEDLTLYINVADIKSGTQVYFYNRKPGERSYRQTRLPGNGPQFTMVIPAQDIRAGYSQYYFEVKEPHGYFGYIEVTVASPGSPYEFAIRKPKETAPEGGGGYDTIFGKTVRSEKNMLEGRIFQLKPGIKKLPRDMQKDQEPFIVVYTRKLDIRPRDLTKGSPGLEDVFKWFGVQYRGPIAVSKSGLYKFRLFSDDGSKLYIDDVLVVDNDGVHEAKSETGEINLSAGTHSVRVDYFQGPRKQIALQLFVTIPGEKEKLFELKDFE
jgi:hypothetical protein